MSKQSTQEGGGREAGRAQEVVMRKQQKEYGEIPIRKRQTTSYTHTTTTTDYHTAKSKSHNSKRLLQLNNEQIQKETDS